MEDSQVPFSQSQSETYLAGFVMANIVGIKHYSGTINDSNTITGFDTITGREILGLICILTETLNDLNYYIVVLQLQDVIKHMKQLKERVKSLEEQVANKKVESAVFVKRSTLFNEDNSSSCDESSDQSLSKIEARVYGKDQQNPQESTYSSHNNNNNKRTHSESTQNSSFPIESSPDQSVASATPTKLRLKPSSSNESRAHKYA